MKNYPFITAFTLIFFLAACTQSMAKSGVKSTVQYSLADTATATAPTPTVTRPVEFTFTFTTTFEPTTPTPTATQTPTAEPTLTSTPQPPLTANSWEVDPILIDMGKGSGDACCYYTTPPDLVLYGNGLLIRTKVLGDFHYQMMARKLERREVCALMNTLDQVGFLDYDPSIYIDPMDGLPGIHISVNAWKKQHISGQVLNKWVYEGGDWWSNECPDPDCGPPPRVLPALSNAFKL